MAKNPIEVIYGDQIFKLHKEGLTKSEADRAMNMFIASKRVCKTTADQRFGRNKYCVYLKKPRDEF
jgi:hypothetical protein